MFIYLYIYIYKIHFADIGHPKFTKSKYCSSHIQVIGANKNDESLLQIIWNIIWPDGSIQKTQNFQIKKYALYEKNH